MRRSLATPTIKAGPALPARPSKHTVWAHTQVSLVAE